MARYGFVGLTTTPASVTGAERVVLEIGTLSAFLYGGLIQRTIPAIRNRARHAKDVLRTRGDKTDARDSKGGLAQQARTR